MKILSTAILLLTTMFISINLNAQLKETKFNQPDLEVSMEDYEVIITWRTAKEINSRYFLVETSTDSIHFTSVRTISAAGSSSFARTYQYCDYDDNSVEYVRITLVDMNGNRFSSQVNTIPSNLGTLGLK